MDHKASYAHHLKIIMDHASKALATCGFESLALDAGTSLVHFADDSHMPFKPTPHFAHWCPVADEGHIILFRSGEKPTLFHVAPQDFWHEHRPLTASYWTDDFNILSSPTDDAAWTELSKIRNVAYIGPNGKRAIEAGLIPNPTNLTAYLDWYRAYKSPYEVACLAEANKNAAAGHRVARDLFLEGASELDIHLGYLRALECEESALPYRTIVCLDEKCAILHYHDKKTARRGKTFLIDAGASYAGYGSDISRTWFAPDVHPIFKHLHAGLNKSQARIAKSLQPGEPYVTYHAQAELDISALLIECEILRGLSPVDAVEARLVQPFFPHGVGHLLGIQVHDVGGHQLDTTGAMHERDLRYPNLRTHRQLEEGMVVTIEPGIYFIPMLLDKFRRGERAANFNWTLIDALQPLGGMRIEDDVLVTSAGGRNLTREQLPE